MDLLRQAQHQLRPAGSKLHWSRVKSPVAAAVASLWRVGWTCEDTQHPFRWETECGVEVELDKLSPSS
eukprot:9833854-Karenia_brevis.AAC.1